MKRLIFLPLMLLCFSVFSQRIIVNDSIVRPSGDDTTIYRRLFTVDNWSISFDHSALDGVDTLDLAGVTIIDGSSFNRIDDNRLPFTLSDSTVTFSKDYFSYPWIAIKRIVGTSTEGTITYTIIKR